MKLSLMRTVELWMIQKATVDEVEFDCLNDFIVIDDEDDPLV